MQMQIYSVVELVGLPVEKLEDIEIPFSKSELG